jgi:ribosomal protein L36
MILYAISADDDAAVSEARAWVRQNGITPDDARLVRRDGMVMVVDKGETWRRIRIVTDGH